MIKKIIKFILPWVSKYQFFKLSNPLLRWILPHSFVSYLLTKKCEELKLDLLDLGGRSACEGYVVIHLSTVEPYGIPLEPQWTQQYVDQDMKGAGSLKWRKLAQPSVTLNYNAIPRLPFQSSYLRGINLSHILEHMSINKGRELLRECSRILRPGGVVRISCPDLKKYASAYIACDQTFWNKVGALPYCNYTNLPTSGAIFAGKAYDNHNRHLWFYDSETVIALLGEAGFKLAVETCVHESSLERIEEIEPRYRALESFYVEGTK